jgi:hypothetical protein
MTELTVTRHAEIRMAQRSILLGDADLIAMVGTKVEDGYVLLEKDYQAVEHFIKKFLQRIRRLRGKRLVVIEGQIVTAFHATRRQHRQLLRGAHERDLESD